MDGDNIYKSSLPENGIISREWLMEELEAIVTTACH
jgi:hypothetical protein